MTDFHNYGGSGGGGACLVLPAMSAAVERVFLKGDGQSQSQGDWHWTMQHNSSCELAIVLKQHYLPTPVSLTYTLLVEEGIQQSKQLASCYLEPCVHCS
jgi:hypothetical protein